MHIFEGGTESSLAADLLTHKELILEFNYNPTEQRLEEIAKGVHSNIPFKNGRALSYEVVDVDDVKGKTSCVYRLLYAFNTNTQAKILLEESF